MSSESTELVLTPEQLALEDACNILSKAVADCLRDMQKEWTGNREMAFVMVRRAMRHLYFDKETMYLGIE